MTPEHHEERLCAWAERTGRPVLSLDYGKAPECECFCFTSALPPMFRIFDRNFGDVGAQREVGQLAGVLPRLFEQFFIEQWALINFVTS